MSGTARPEPLTGRTADDDAGAPSLRTVGPAIGDRPPPRRADGEAGEVEGAAVPQQQPDKDPLTRELGQVIDQLELSALQKRCLRARWLASVAWMDRKARQAQRAYYGLRLFIIIGGLIIPALVSLDLGAGPAAVPLKAATFCLSLLVAIVAAIEGFFRYGERWRHYRSIVERLKIEGWQFFQLSGPYRRPGTHAAAYPVFAARIEEINQSDVQQYITQIVREREAGTEQARARPAQPAAPSDA
ncbi:MAG TPA: DUF4231 domain-containing protein [Geminicoccaceae bacterium]|nr:DUF4231 domain-containing protein [Geminicoccaceae bacterium]